MDPSRPDSSSSSNNNNNSNSNSSSSDNDRAAAALRRLAGPQALPIAVALNAAVTETYRFWSARGALAVAAPSLIDSISSPSGPGSDSVPVEVVINGRPVFLTDSSQFTLELATRALRRPTYYVMPSFRGERSDPTHLAEFLHAEVELPGTLDDVLGAAEEYVRDLIGAIGRALSAAGDPAPGAGLGQVPRGGAGRWPRLRYGEVIDTLRAEPDAVRQVGAWWLPTRAGEQRLAAMSDGPVWLLGYPAECVPFYQAREPGQPFARCADLLVPGIGEILGAGQRHAASGSLRESMAAHRVETASYEWYIALRDSHPGSTAGFGLGLERLIAWLLGLPDIAMVPLFPRRNEQPVDNDKPVGNRPRGGTVGPERRPGG